MTRWTKHCSAETTEYRSTPRGRPVESKGVCGNYIPNEYELCDFHLLQKYGLRPHYIGYDSPEEAEMAEGVYAEADVVRALREAERRSHNEASLS